MRSGDQVHDLTLPIVVAVQRLRHGLHDLALEGLGYVGADVVLDARRGPVILELNARPGLAIQVANRAGLLPRLRAVEAGRESA